MLCFIGLLIVGWFFYICLGNSTYNQRVFGEKTKDDIPGIELIDTEPYCKYCGKANKFVPEPWNDFNPKTGEKITKGRGHCGTPRCRGNFYHPGDSHFSC